MASEGVTYGKILRLFTFRSPSKVISRYLLDDFILSLTTVRGVIEQLLTKASQETDVDVDVEDEMVDVDAGSDLSDEDDAPGTTPSFLRPQGVTDSDWRVYEVLNELLEELREKFKAIWA